MPDVLPILAGLILLLLLGIMLMLLGVRSALARLHQRLEQLAKGGNTAGEAPGSGEAHDPNSAFERFLAEDPSRHALPKSEQAAAYRQWRREKGMNWSHS